MVFETVFEWILADPLRVGAAALTLMVILFSGGMWAGSVNNDRKAFKAAFARVDAKLDHLDERINLLDAKFDAKIDSLDAKVNTKIDSLDAKIDAKINRILGRLPTPAATDKTR